MVLATLWDCPAMVRSQRKWPWSPDHWTAPWKPRLLNFFPPQNENYLEAAMRESAPLVVVRSTHQHVCQAGLAFWKLFAIHSDLADSVDFGIAFSVLFWLVFTANFNSDEKLTYQRQFHPTARSCSGRYFNGTLLSALSTLLLYHTLPLNFVSNIFQKRWWFKIITCMINFYRLWHIQNDLGSG